MGLLAIIFVILSCLMVLALSDKTRDINVVDYGAVGDGYTENSQAFLKAWDVTCSLVFAESANIIVPEGMTFVVNPVLFEGPCKPKEINFKIFGTIMSPKPAAWKGIDSTQWLAFRRVSSLTVDGYGTINGQGSSWWSLSCKNNHREACITSAPAAIKFISCSNTYLRNLQFVDSAQTHIVIKQSEWFHVTNLRIKAPETSPNTDGIHIEDSKHVYIDHSAIGSGDDCISIGDQTSDIRITNILCGPGHGISVGSLGKGGSNVQVKNIHVSHVNFYQTTNGVRIKTWKGATGYARDITFEYLNFTNVQNPIIIDQYYCNKLYPGDCKAVINVTFTFGCILKAKSNSGVQLSDVTYKNAIGTSITEVAIRLNCSKSVPCTGILLDSIQLKPALHSHRNEDDQLISSCTNAHGRTKGVIKPNIPCLLRK
ncbi:hypothetical protein AQUCO_02000129v1 [Aquilegia coerulea]|uniref:Polygalacturonase n=1 Tax=Aquilegia coerulea TaxID=218851 RepID=A0A2G5DGV2_AQUCA|nr:hypothetical protein AQUCO_02000129v1 [Aquilegia coerulea]